MSRIRVFTNPLDASEVIYLRSEKVLDVFNEIKKKNDKARIYIQPACQQNDVTPSNAVDLASLQMLSKTHNFDIVCGAGEPATIFAVASLVLSVGMAVYTYLNMPEQNQLQQKSANNELSNRVNRENINGRIPDPFGRVNAVPNLAAPPFMYYDADGIEREEVLMYIGRGSYLIEDIKDGDTYASTIDGFATSVYAPGQNITGTPQIQIGTAFNHAPLVAKKSEAITGQTLAEATESVIDTEIEGTMYPQFPNRLYLVGGGLDASFDVGEAIQVAASPLLVKNESLAGSSNIEMAGVITVGTSKDIQNPNNFKKIEINALLATDLTNGVVDLSGIYDVAAIVKSGSFAYEITLLNASVTNPNWLLLTADTVSNISSVLTNNTESINISGSYSAITAVTSEFIELAIPAGLQSEWNKLEGKSITESTIEISKATDNWQGWFYINFKDIEHLIFNFYYPKGVYSVGTNGKTYHHNTAYTLEYQELENGSPVGSIFTHSYAEVYKSTTSFGVTRRFNISSGFKDGVRIRVRRDREIQGESKTSRECELKIKSVYACSKLEKLVYDNVTMVRALTVATDGALSVKERRWNCIATRLINDVPETRFDRIVEAITIDPFIGRRAAETIDLGGVYDSIVDYFGTTKATEFNFTFDQSNLSYEETLSQIASMVFCNVRRSNNKVYFQFEKENPNSSILFNHRNKAPGTETRTEKYVVDNEYDGVEAVWRDANNKWIEATIKLPNDQIKNAKKIDLAGVTNLEQAHLLAHRAWNKIQHQRETVQFTAYGEADLVTLNDRIAVTDDTVPSLLKLGDESAGYTSGDVLSQINQVIEISQPILLDVNQIHVIHLQLKNKFVETMRVTQGTDEYHLVLERLPIMPLVTSDQISTVYSITLETNKEIEAYLVSEKSPSSSYESQITAINYDARYYTNDKDIINNLI